MSSHALAILAAEGVESHGLVLEAPFNNMRDELRAHPFAQVNSSTIHCLISYSIALCTNFKTVFFVGVYVFTMV